AALLGQPVVVGYPMQEVLAPNRHQTSKTQNSYGVRIGTDGEKLPPFSMLSASMLSAPLSPLDVAPSVTNTDKLVESKAEILAEKLTQQKQQSDITA
ncbi:MAG: hypothetical protein ACYTX0_60145, partial [Nostoc sp.]